MKAQAILLLLWLLLPLWASAADIKPAQLAEGLGARISRVPEFEFIRHEAERLGVRVYLFGGTAAAYGHYVRQDMAREAGDSRYPPELYDYDYTNIFRSTQDLDIVVDGSPEQAAALEHVLKSKFPHFVGDKPAGWEVRPLAVARGEKEALLDNPNFLNQHTDSHSTGLIEITKAEGSPVKDVRDWKSKEPQFLRDIADQKLHYYFNPLHESTSRAEKGLNPPILSAIRYLTKAFQYELEITGQDREKIGQIVQAFDPRSLSNDYLKRWVEKNGKKLFQHAVNFERAWNELEDLGLRKKLIAINNNPTTEESLAWWMDKEPLRSQPIGQGKGLTAAEIAKSMSWEEISLAHETRGYIAYESITRSKAGDLNGLISRGGKAGETAAHGDGFYTRLGRQGARNTGFTIRMVLDPNAREGSDFIRKEDYYLIRNKAAVRVVPEQIDLSLSEYLKMLADGKSFPPDDRALFESFKRKVSRGSLLSSEEERGVVDLAKKHAGDCQRLRDFCREFLSLPLSQKYPGVWQEMFKGGLPADFPPYLLSLPHWQKEEQLKSLITVALGNISSSNPNEKLMIDVLSLPIAAENPQWLSSLIDRGLIQGRVATKALSLPHWQAHPKLIKALIKKWTAPDSVIRNILTQPGWEKHPDLLRAFLRKGKYLYRDIVEHLLTKPHWAKHQEKTVRDMLKASESADHAITEFILTQPGAPEKYSDVAEAILKRDLYLKDKNRFIGLVLSQPQWADRSDWVDLLMANDSYHQRVADMLFSKPHWQQNENFPRWMEAALAGGKADWAIAASVLGNPGPQVRLEWLERLAKKKNHELTKPIAESLHHPGWADRPEAIEIFFREADIRWDRPWDEPYIPSLFKEPHWENHPALRELVGGKTPTAKNVKAALDTKTLRKSAIPSGCAGSFSALTP